MYALDSNTLIDLFRERGEVRSRFNSVTKSDVAIPSVVLFEIETGILKMTHSPKGHREDIDRLLSLVPVLPFDSKAARTAASIRADLERLGTPLGPYDLLIAGTAMSVGATLVTRNAAEFDRVKGLKTVNWY